GFESILESLFGPGLVNDITLFQDCEPQEVSDWSSDGNCLFCCLRREKVKVRALTLHGAQNSPCSRLNMQEQSRISRLERQAQEFLNAVFHRKDLPRFSEPYIPLVAREIMQRMIHQFAAEYTSKTTQDDSPLPNGSINGGGGTAVASAQNPVLSKLLMADQDGPLDLSVKKTQDQAEPCQQDGVLDLSTKKNHKTSSGLSSASGPKGRDGIKARFLANLTERTLSEADEEDVLLQKSLQDGLRETFIGSQCFKPPLARSLRIKEELLSQKHRLLSQPAALSLANLESAGLLNHGQSHSLLGQKCSSSFLGSKAHLDSLLKLKQGSLHHHHNNQGSKAHHSEGKRDQGHSPPVDLKIPQVRGMDLSWDSHASELYGYGGLGVAGGAENTLSRKLRAILPKQNRRGGSLGSLLDGAADYWSADLDHPSSGPAYSTSDVEGDPNSKQPRKKRGRYRQYNSEILEEAITVVMSGKMSVSKAQSMYGIPHSTLEYKVKERMGTLKNPPKKKLKLMMKMETGGPDFPAESENTPTSTPRDDGQPL
uniref:Ligand dependent nuclear receptor corepressor n=1 Tax=Tetraodon nigroviridis TaxID=99883 RepID=H3CD85_TETNG